MKYDETIYIVALMELMNFGDKFTSFVLLDCYKILGVYLTAISEINIWKESVLTN